MFYLYALICGLGQFHECRNVVIPEYFQTRTECKIYEKNLRQNMKEGYLARGFCLRR